jgi:hypothetical protein
VSRTKHTLLATLPVGDPDLGAEQEALIYFTHRKGMSDFYDGSVGAWMPGWDSEIEFFSAVPYCNGKPSPFLDYPSMQQQRLDEIASNWLESDDGQQAAFEAVRDDDEAAREYAAELRRDA